jgi:hypothetical protein
MGSSLLAVAGEEKFSSHLQAIPNDLQEPLLLHFSLFLEYH